MITAERLREIAFWSAELSEEEIERARRGVSEKSFAKGAYICHKGDRMEAWTGVISGLVRLGTVSQKGKAITLAGMRAGIWFGEGSVLKNEPRQYDLVALREVRLAMMNMGTFFWLFEHSAEPFAMIQMNIAREMSRRLRVSDEALFRLTMGADQSAPETAFHAI